MVTGVDGETNLHGSARVIVKHGLLEMYQDERKTNSGAGNMRLLGVCSVLA